MACDLSPELWSIDPDLVAICSEELKSYTQCHCINMLVSETETTATNLLPTANHGTVRAWDGTCRMMFSKTARAVLPVAPNPKLLVQRSHTCARGISFAIALAHGS